MPRPFPRLFGLTPRPDQPGTSIALALAVALIPFPIAYLALVYGGGMGDRVPHAVWTPLVLGAIAAVITECTDALGAAAIGPLTRGLSAPRARTLRLFIRGAVFIIAITAYYLAVSRLVGGYSARFAVVALTLGIAAIGSRIARDYLRGIRT